MPSIQQNITIDDYKHYYADCVGIFTDNGEKFPALVSLVEGSSTKFIVKGFLIKDYMWVPFTSHPSKIEFPPQNTGYVNIYDFSVFVRRIAYRQWKRGYHKANYTIKAPEELKHYYELIPEIKYMSPSNIVLINNLFNRKYPSSSEVIAELLDGNALCKAISPNVLLSVSNGEGLGLYYDNQLIGVFDGDLVVLTQESSIFMEEIAALFPQNRIKIYGK